jgi:hypothetical protein
VAWLFINGSSLNLRELFAGVVLLGPLAEHLVALWPALESFRMPQAIWVQIPLSFFAGGLYGGVGLAQVNLLGALTPREGRTTAMAVHWTLVGVLGALGPLVGGLIMDGLGPPDPASRWRVPGGVPFAYQHLLVALHMAISFFVAAPLLARVRVKANLTVGTALGRLLMNPLRVMSSIYNIYTMSAAVSSDERARAVRELGEQRTALAITDLIARLDDPAAEVREAAALALGKIGSPDAIDALVRKLEDPNSDLAPQIARALRESPDPRAVDALVDRLHDPDRETRTETARTLGVIGDRRAAHSLLEVLQETQDEKVVSASSEALPRLGEMAAIYQVLPRLRGARNPVLKRSLAVAVGDLLGRERGEFYRIVTREQQGYGAEAERLLERLRHDIRGATRDRLTLQGESLVARTAEVQIAYEDREYGRCLDLMFELAIGLAALKHGVRFGGNAEVLVEDLIWREERFAVGVWYLHLLREHRPQTPSAASATDMIDILLGIYFLAGQTLQADPGSSA